MKNDKDFSVITKKHEGEQNISGLHNDDNIAWHKVNNVLFSIYVLPRKYSLDVEF